MQERIRREVLSRIGGMVGLRPGDTKRMEPALESIFEGVGMAVVAGLDVSPFLSVLEENYPSKIAVQGEEIWEQKCAPNSVIRASWSLQNGERPDYFLSILTARTKMEFFCIGGQRIFGHFGMYKTTPNESYAHVMEEFDRALSLQLHFLLEHREERKRRSSWMHRHFYPKFWWYTAWKNGDSEDFYSASGFNRKAARTSFVSESLSRTAYVHHGEYNDTTFAQRTL